MKAQEIVLRIKPTAADYRRVLFRHQRKKYALVAAMVFFTATGCVLSSLAIRPKDPSASDPRLAMIAAAIFLPFFVGGVLYWTIRSQANKVAAQIEETELTFTGEGVYISNSTSNAHAKWAAYRKVVEFQQDFLLFPRDNFIIPLPKRFFFDETQVKEFRSLLAAQLGDKAKLLV